MTLRGLLCADLHLRKCPLFGGLTMEELMATSISDYQSDVRAIVTIAHSLIKYYTDTS